MSATSQFKLESFVAQREIAKSSAKSFECDFARNKFCQKDVREHTGCVNALQFSHNERLLTSGGDDGEIRIWNVDEMIMRKEPKPNGLMEKKHASNIFSLDFDLDDKCVYSGERNGIVYKHNIETNQLIFASSLHANEGDVYHLHQNPIDNNIVAVTRCWQIALLDDRDRSSPDVLRLPPGYWYSAEFHREAPRLLLATSKKAGPNIYDLRNIRVPIFRRSDFNGIPNRDTDWMGAMWSPSGNQFMAIRNEETPMFYDLISRSCFNLRSQTYMNSNTVKTMTFIDDYTVATGSDRRDIHIWDVPRPDQTKDDDFVNSPEIVVPEEVKVLKGHRSIPNQVRFSKQNQLLVSSGVEKIIKLWSDRRLPWSYDTPFARRIANTYNHSLEEEFRREEMERKAMEEAWDRDGEMEGRATWDDVFGGDEDTREDRETVEMFDVLGRDSDDELDMFMMRRRVRAWRGELVAARNGLGDSDDSDYSDDDESGSDESGDSEQENSDDDELGNGDIEVEDDDIDDNDDEGDDEDDYADFIPDID